MMKKTIFIASLLVMASCAMEEVAEPMENNVPRVTTVTVGLPQTKVAVSETDGKCTWDATDCIAIYDASASQYVEFALTEGAGTGTAVFTAEGDVTVADGASIVYPAAYAYAYTKDGEAVMTIPNVVDKDSKVPVVMTGNVVMKDGVPTGTFSHVSGVVKFTLHDVPAYAAGLVIKSESSLLAGPYVDGRISSSTAAKAIKVRFPYKTGYNYSTENDGADDPDDAVIFVSLPAGEYTGLQVYLIDGDGDVIEGTQKNITSARLSAGDYVVMPVLDLKKSQLRKDYVKVIGVKWAKGNLVRDESNAWHSVRSGVDDGFQTGWGLHDEQYRFINWDGSISTSGSYTYDNSSFFDLFSWGGIGRFAGYHSGRLVPDTANYDISCKVFWGYVNTDAFVPEKLTLLDGDACFSSELDSKGNTVYTKDGETKSIAGDVAYWASKGKYCMPNKAILSELSHPSTSKASYQYGKYVKDNHTVYGYLYTTPQGDVVRSNEEVTFTDADLESGLFLPITGRRSNTVNNKVINQGTHAFYRSSTFGNPSHATAGQAHPECATSLWFNGSNLPAYGFSHGTSVDATSDYSSICTLSNAAGGCIRPVLVDDTVTYGDVEPLNTAFSAVVGAPLPEWTEGCLDIHAINSGRGECTFFVLPDGTSLCVDAGEILPTGGDHPHVDPKPDADTRAYMVYANYMKKYLPGSETTLDYMLMTHFHNDHFGTTYNDVYPLVTRGSYSYPYTGIMALYDEVPFDKIIDRAYDGDKKYEEVVPGTGQDFSPGYGYYGQFVSWAKKEHGMAVERAENGSTAQLALVNNPSAYPDFKIQINAVNGYYWNGSASVDAYDRTKGQPYENGNSISFLLSYGEFDYLTSGDAGTNTSVAAPLAESINRRVEAMKSHHHFSWNAMSSDNMKIYQPKVIVSQSFYDHQPDMGHSWSHEGDATDYAARSSSEFQKAWDAYSATDKYWFFTNIHKTTSSTYPDEVAKMAGTDGHVVIRVAEGGEFFYVYMLDDTDFNYTVKNIHGPIYCHQ